MGGAIAGASREGGQHQARVRGACRSDIVSCEGAELRRGSRVVRVCVGGEPAGCRIPRIVGGFDELEVLIDEFAEIVRLGRGQRENDGRGHSFARLTVAQRPNSCIARVCASIASRGPSATIACPS